MIKKQYVTIGVLVLILLVCGGTCVIVNITKSSKPTHTKTVKTTKTPTRPASRTPETTPTTTSPKAAELTTTSPETVDNQQQRLPTVKAGSYCSPAGAKGVTTSGTVLTCKKSSDGKYRWKS